MKSVVIAYLAHYHSLSALILLTSHRTFQHALKAQVTWTFQLKRHMLQLCGPIGFAIWAQVEWTYKLVTLVLRLHGPILI